MRAIVCLAAAAALLAGCDTRKSYRVSSDPAGAEVLVEGQVVGVTPTTVLLDAAKEAHLVALRRTGFTTVEHRVMTRSLLEGPTQHCAAVACAPCCFFVPLALCYERSFVPRSLDVKLERSGQGIEVVCRPLGAKVFVDGVLMAQATAVAEESIEGETRVRAPADYGVAVVPLEPRVVKVEIRAEGFRTQEYQVQVRAEEYVHLRLDLEPVDGRKPSP